jgi:hypothetical protein
MAVIEVDAPVEAKTLEDLQSLDHLTFVRQIDLD